LSLIRLPACLLHRTPAAAHLLLFCIEAHSLGNVLPTLVAPDVERHLKPETDKSAEILAHAQQHLAADEAIQS
jgi:hypothetical protein